MHEHKLYAALAFARANGLSRTVIDGRSAGWASSHAVTYLDVRQALEDLGITEAFAAKWISLYKVAMTWPLERKACGVCRGPGGNPGRRRKTALIENQLKEQLYNWSADIGPQVIGKFDEGASGSCRPAN